MEKKVLGRLSVWFLLFCCAKQLNAQQEAGALYGISEDGALYSLSPDFSEVILLADFPFEAAKSLAVSPTGEFFTINEGAIYKLDISNGTAEAFPGPPGYWVEGIFFDENGKMSVIGEIRCLCFETSKDYQLLELQPSTGEWQEQYTYLFFGSYSTTHGSDEPDELRTTTYNPLSNTWFSNTWESRLFKLQLDAVSPTQSISHSFPGNAVLFYADEKLLSYHNNTFFEVNLNDGSTTEITQIEPIEFRGFISVPPFEVRQVLLVEDCLCLPEEIAGNVSSRSAKFFNNSLSSITINGFETEVAGITLIQALPISVPPKSTVILDFEVDLPHPIEVKSKFRLLTDEGIPYSAYELYLNAVDLPLAADGAVYFIEDPFGITKLSRYDSSIDPALLRNTTVTKLAVNSKGQLFGFKEGKLVQLSPTGYNDRTVSDLPFRYIHEMIFDFADHLIFLVDSGEGLDRKIQFYRFNPENMALTLLSETKLGHEKLEGGGFKAVITPDYFATVAIQRSGLYEEMGPLFKVNLLTGTSKFINSLGHGTVRDMTFTSTGKLMVAYGSKLHLMDRQYFMTERIFPSGEVMDMSSMMPRIGEPAVPDFGVMEVGEIKQQEYNFLNTSDEPVTISEVSSEHAGLTVASLWQLPQTLAPGDAMPLQISLHSKVAGDFLGNIVLTGPDFNQVLAIKATSADFDNSRVESDAVLLAIENRIVKMKETGLQHLSTLTIPKIDRMDISPSGKVYVTSRANIYQVHLATGLLKQESSVMGVNFFNGIRFITDSTYMAIGNHLHKMLRLSLIPGGERLEKEISFSGSGLGIWDNQGEINIYSTHAASQAPRLVISKINFTSGVAQPHIINNSYIDGIDLDADRNGDLLAFIRNRSNDWISLAKLGESVETTEMLGDFPPGTSVSLAVGKDADLSNIGTLISSAKPETKKSVAAYPNPFSSIIEFKFGGQKPTAIRVYDIAGSFIKVLEVNETGASWNGTTAAGTPVKNGIYLVKVLNRDGSGTTLKVIYEGN